MKIGPLFVFNMILVAILLYMVFREVYLRIQAKRSATWIEEDEFRERMRKSQVIDVREKTEFDAGHVLGARNIPYSVFKSMIQSIRKDQPVFLYDQKKAMAIRAANILRKEGYTDIFLLKGGYNDWTGKIKVEK